MLGGLPPPSRRLPRICLLQDQIGGHDGGSREGGREGDENAREARTRARILSKDQQVLSRTRRILRFGKSGERKVSQEKGDTASRRGGYHLEVEARNDHRDRAPLFLLPLSSFSSPFLFLFPSVVSTVSNGTTFLFSPNHALDLRSLRTVPKMLDKLSAQV